MVGLDVHAIIRGGVSAHNVLLSPLAQEVGDKAIEAGRREAQDVVTARRMLPATSWISAFSVVVFGSVQMSSIISISPT